MDVTEAVNAIRRAARKCMDDTATPFELESDKDCRDMLYYLEGIRTMERMAVSSIKAAFKEGNPDGE